MGADLGPCVVLITGVMAAGKSTVAQLLAESLPRAVHVRGDVFRRMSVSGRAEMTPDGPQEARSQLDLRQRISAQVADAYADDGWTAVVQDIVLREDLPRYVGRIRTRPLHVVVLAPRRRPCASGRKRAGRRVTGSGPSRRSTRICGAGRPVSACGWTRPARDPRRRFRPSSPACASDPACGEAAPQAAS